MVYVEDKIHGFEEPEGNPIIWCYMNLTKFIHLIQTNSLYSTTLSTLEDEDEGSPLGTYEWNQEINKWSFYLKNRQKDFKDLALEIPHSYMVNCWTRRDKESDLLWKRFCSNGLGVAIQSKLQDLRDAFAGTKQDVNIGKVKYIDYKNPEEQVSGFLMAKQVCLKRRKFKDEKELRAVIKDNDILLGNKPIKQAQSGRLIEVNLEKLINSVYLSPHAEIWELEVIRALINRYNLNLPVEMSTTNVSP
ncbi:MAG: hypothetical protein ABIG42_01640 [bacterium]